METSAAYDRTMLNVLMGMARQPFRKREKTGTGTGSPATKPEDDPESP
jgi:hypothetical protein